jgi:hypothetical protein
MSTRVLLAVLIAVVALAWAAAALGSSAGERVYLPLVARAPAMNCYRDKFSGTVFCKPAVKPYPAPLQFR